MLKSSLHQYIFNRNIKDSKYKKKSIASNRGVHPTEKSNPIARVMPQLQESCIHVKYFTPSLKHNLLKSKASSFLKLLLCFTQQNIIKKNAIYNILGKKKKKKEKKGLVRVIVIYILSLLPPGLLLASSGTPLVHRVT